MINKQNLLIAIKKAMQGEMSSVTLYMNAAAHSDDQEVKDFFQRRCEEERQHYNYLLSYYQEISRDLPPSDLQLSNIIISEKNPIFSDDFIKRIGEDQYLFSAISTALLLEKDAFEHYHKSSQDAFDITLEAFFSVLELWEKQHYDELLNIQKEAENYYWQENNFEPF
jgi:rubrerythrin